MLLYLDLCCLKRPFDDQTQPRSDVFVTCDDRLLAVAGRLGGRVKVRVGELIAVAREVLS